MSSSPSPGRAHRAPLSRAEALGEIVSRKGRQFDPEVVEAFERALPGMQQHQVESADPAEAATSDKGR